MRRLRARPNVGLALGRPRGTAWDHYRVPAGSLLTATGSAGASGQTETHAKSLTESAAREPEGGMPARVARRDAVMERRMARTPFAKECPPQGGN